MRPGFGIFVATLMALALLRSAVFGAAPAAPKAAKPDTVVPQSDCTKAGCHSDVKDYKAIHGPVNVNACDACHKLSDASSHKFVLAREKAALCTFCHEMNIQGAKVVHKPVAEGQCLACHNPHGGNDRHFMRGQSMRDTCDACHRDVVTGKKYLHGPVAAGACDGCHAPHTSQLPKLLIATGRDLCVTCHREMDEQLHDAKVVHPPVKSDCMQCHDPHGSNYPMQVRKPAAELCESCHADVRKAIADAPHKHSVVTSGAACLSCHTPHGGDLANLLKNKQIEVCLSCHDKAITTGDGRTIASLAEVLDPKMYKHGPIREGDCGGCHNAHGGVNANLLVKPYPPTFYANFALQRYALCFSCHDSQLVLTARTGSLTGFRNGDKNLHYVHVNRAQRGRTCLACHETHVSQYPMHLRESVPFGQWDMPIDYKPTKTGGSCAPGCHRPLAYDRVNPVANPAPASGPAGPSPADPHTPNTENNPR